MSLAVALAVFVVTAVVVVLAAIALAYSSDILADRIGWGSLWVGSVLVMFVTAAAAVPLGVAAGVYLEEYAPRNWMTDLIEINVTNLAGVPSIIYGLMALGLLVYQFRLGQSVLTCGVKLAFLILPIVIVAGMTTGCAGGVPRGVGKARLHDAVTLAGPDRRHSRERSGQR